MPLDRSKRFAVYLEKETAIEKWRENEKLYAARNSFTLLSFQMSFRLWLADLSSQADALAYRGSKDATHREHAAGEMRGGTRGKYQ